MLRDTGKEREVFEELETRLNRIANESEGRLCLSIPALYIEGRPL